YPSVRPVFVYQADAMPEQAGWTIVQIFCNPQLWVADGHFFQHVDMCPDVQPPGEQSASYKRAMDEFVGAPTLFIEWRAQTNADRSELPWGGGLTLSAASDSGANYRFSIAGDHAELNRDNLLPIVSVDLEAGVAHTFRLELVSAASYA